MTLTCATYNILHGYHRDLILKNIRFLIERGADVICLQEAEVRFEESLKTLLKDRDLAHWQAEFAHAGRGGDVATLWNARTLTLKRANLVHLPKLRTPTALELLQRARIQRAALLAEFEWGNRTLQVANAHLSWEGGSRYRMRQLRFLRAELEKFPADFRIVTGDFNTVAMRALRGVHERRVEKILGSEFRNAFPKLPWTYDISYTDPSNELRFIMALARGAGVKWRQRFDYMFAKDMDLIEGQMHDLPGSDHRPLIATFSMDKTARAGSDARVPLQERT
jgi:endonuclease/exonuclease/phosphatase family metal-dependent hydrolase